MSKSERQSELEELRARLSEAEETLNAIRRGEVDALVVSQANGEQIYTLHGADHSSRVLLQEMNEGALTLLPDGPILYCNKRFAGLVKLPQEQIIGTSFDQYVAPGDQDAFQALLRQAQEGGAKGEIGMSAADGTVVPTYCSVNPIQQIEHELCLCVVVTDLTEQKRNEEILASGTLANSILDQAGEIIVVCDDAGSIIEASRATHEFCGRNVLRERFDEVFPISAANGTPVSCSRDETAGRSSHLSDCLGGKKVHGVEVRLRRADGEKCDFLMSAGPLQDFHERVLGCVFTFSDVSKLKQAEEALRDSEQRLREQAQGLERQLIASGRLVSLGEITASMAHEFNNPLGIIMGFVEDLLSDIDPGDPQLQSLQIIDEETKRCQKIIQGLMEFARPTGTTPLLTDIGSLIAKTLQMIDARLYKQKVGLTKVIAPDLPQIHVDAQQLEQVLVNLYLNALDAMLGGGNLMVAAALEMGNPEPRIMITVADTGMGIDANDLQKIFQPFFTARKKAGLGLGLSICERIVKNHGGRIEVESRLNQGTIFRIRLPINYPLE
jgi:PAS domain S-box-containing protein